jgi:hypothetical protein
MTYVTMEQFVTWKTEMEERLIALEQERDAAQAAAEEYGQEVHLSDARFLVAVTPASPTRPFGPTHVAEQNGSQDS